MANKIKITQVRSTIGRLKNQKDTIRALGIRKRGRSVVHEETASIRGMVNTVRHLVTVEKVDGE
ncbi:MAG: 50S ribosomal protein L30 [Chitinivibrionales bacterium]|nr:50S ribosomal protein L30 [Chitinivibrionales bacterium]MBD3358122.1 50S ribosomal protein L30 [Chitinivibrionales bacterium]